MRDALLTLDTTGEIRAVQSFIGRQAGEHGRLVIGVSGGIDSDVVARLSVSALGVARVRLFLVLQADMNESYVLNARQLAQDLSATLVELDFAGVPEELVSVLAAADDMGRFSGDNVLDVGKAKNSLRTWVCSMYAERGYTVVGCSNRTESETGFYLPFGDALCHIMPIAHLYKTQVRLLAKALGTRPQVIHQPASAAYWIGETDLEDLAFWMFHGAPVLEELHLTENELAEVREIHRELSFEVIDRALYFIGQGTDLQTIVDRSGLNIENSARLLRLVHSVPDVKGRPLKVRLPIPEG